ncbi:MAG: IS982 family transposase, partial [Sediminibacterium sp.]|nr:IS982 family transposase [Sediminibacterium sp.]
MHNIRSNFIKILKVVKEILSEQINEKGNYTRRGTVPKFSDIEVIALSLTSECLVIDSENLLFSKLATEYVGDFDNL